MIGRQALIRFKSESRKANYIPLKEINSIWKFLLKNRLKIGNLLPAITIPE